MCKCNVIRDPETVAVLQNLPDGSDHPGVLRKQDGAMVHYWRDGRKVRCREVSKTEACDILFGINDWHERQRAATSDPFVAGVVQHLVETFGDTSSAMMDELAGPAPDLFSHEVATRAHVLSAAGAGIKGQWEAFDRTLEAPECPKCKRRMNRQGDRVRIFINNVDRMKYDRYTAHGLQTVSGAVEGACKHVVATRVKKTGARWSKMGADAVLAARCLIHNNEFVDLLDWRLAKSAA